MHRFITFTWFHQIHHQHKQTVNEREKQQHCKKKLDFRMHHSVICNLTWFDCIKKWFFFNQPHIVMCINALLYRIVFTYATVRISCEKNIDCAQMHAIWADEKKSTIITRCLFFHRCDKTMACKFFVEHEPSIIVSLSKLDERKMNQISQCQVKNITHGTKLKEHLPKEETKF